MKLLAPKPSRLKTTPFWYLVATWFCSGRAAKAPGTFGSLASLIILIPLSLFFPPISFAVFLGICFAIGLWATHQYVSYTQENDPKAVVIDETCGQTIPFFALFWLPEQPGILFFVLSFIFFRFFDILKPFPINLIDQHMHNSFGIMLDDLVAGIYALICLLLCFFFVF